MDNRTACCALSAPSRVRRLLVLVLTVGVVALASPELVPWQQTAAAQESSTDDSGDPPATGLDLWQSVLSWVFYILFLLLSLASVFFIIEHSLTIRKGKILPEWAMAELEQKIARYEVNEAIEFCLQPENYCLATEVVLSGLERYQGSEFGFAEYKTAVEEAGEDQTAKMFRKTEVLGVIGAIAPMIGLTGTVLGMILAFQKIAQTAGAAKPDELAGGISLALVTTLLGLVLAIPTMIAYSFFRNKIESLVAEAGKRIERIMMPLGRKR